MVKRFLCLWLIFISGCIDPVNFKFNGQVDHLVVEGNFTDRAGLNYVRLSVSQPYSLPYNKFEEDATVYISSEEGERIDFDYSEAGYYYPDSTAAGFVGHTYRLHIITTDSRTYVSSPVTLKAPVKIDSIHFEYDEESIEIKGKMEKVKKPGYRVFVDFTDPAGEDNFYRWSYDNQYEVETQPLNHMLEECQSGCPIPDPLPCCATCWINEREELFYVSNDRHSDGKKVRRKSLFFIPFDRYLNIKYKLTLYQHAITQEAYNFFQVIEQQRGSSGTVFDPPPSEVKGNMFNINDEHEQVIGIFDASAVSIMKITILAEDIPYDLPEFIYPDDCRDLENSTTERPEDW